MKLVSRIGSIFLLVSGSLQAAPLIWQDWRADLFTRAQQENRFVLLDLEAVWCHWCHVMDETTYHDAQVQALINDKYLPVRVDQDANPDLANRYEDYGWPATVIFAPDGSEIVKRRGYIPPAQMRALLQAVIDDPSPGPSITQALAITPASEPVLREDLRRQIVDNYFELYDAQYGAWGTRQKFIDADSMEYALRGAQQGDERLAQMARQTLDNARVLIDPVWGGVYQYSVGPTWDDAHFEKIMSFQSQYLRHYTQAYAIWREEKDLQSAQLMVHYLSEFLSAPDAGFYVSQDADASAELHGKEFYAGNDAQRRAAPMPKIDQHRYARENGWAITALAHYAGVTGDTAALDRAVRAARWVLAERNLPGGGFSHDQPASETTPHLGDSLYLAQACLSLYAVTAEREWLTQATRALDFVDQTFRHAQAGFITAPVRAGAAGVFAEPVRQLDENIAVTRTANLIFRYTGESRYQALAEHAMRYLGAAELVQSRRLVPGIVLAADELMAEPLHITVVGGKHDATARALHAAASHWPQNYKRVEWWDRSEGPLANADVQYPELKKPAVFVCTDQTCSLPMYNTAQLEKRLRAAQTDP